MDETYAIQVMLVQLPDLNNSEKLKQYIIEGFKKDSNSNRFKLIETKADVVQSNIGSCVKNMSKAEDTQAKKQSESTKSMILEIINLTCKHPAIKNAGVNISYSHRYYDGNKDPRLESKSKTVFDNFQFNK